jgi:hypothetical protein
MTTTNATLSGAIKTVLEQLGLGVQVFRDVAPPKAHLPYVVVTENVAWRILHHGDTDASDEDTVREQAQLDIYQAKRAPDGTRIEDYGLEDEICHALQKTRLPTWVHHVDGLRVIMRSTGEVSSLRRTIVTIEIDRRYVSRFATQ